MENRTNTDFFLLLIHTSDSRSEFKNFCYSMIDIIQFMRDIL